MNDVIGLIFNNGKGFNEKSHTNNVWQSTLAPETGLEPVTL